MNITGTTWFTKFHKFTVSLGGWLEWMGLAALAVMVVIALIDVVGSKAFNWPLPGSTEITGVIQVVAIAGGFTLSKIDGRHIRVGFLIDKVTGRGKAALEIFSAVLSLGFFAIASWMVIDYGVSLVNRGTETFLLGIPLYPFAFWIGICCIPMCLVIIVDLISAIGEVIK